MKRLNGQKEPDAVADPFEEVMSNIPDDVGATPAEPELPEDLEYVLEGNEEPDPAPAAVQTDPAVLKILDTLAANQAPKVEAVVPQRAKAEVVDMAKMRADFNEKLHTTDDPASLVDEYAQQLIGPQLAQQNIRLQGIAKQGLMNTPKYKYVFDNFGTEIETVIAGLPANQQNHPDAYKFAADQVMITRFDDVVAGMASEAAPAKVTGARLGRTNMVAGQSQAAPTRKKRQVKYTQYDVAMAKNYGVSIQDYMQRKGA